MIREYIKKQILLFDGAMGTYFASIHNDPFYKCEYGNITCPNTIKEIHNRYLQAGAKAIKTNTFALYDSNERQEFTIKEMITSGFQIATDCAKSYDAFVFCDIGPIPTTKEKHQVEKYKEMIDCFFSLGGKYFIFETFTEVATINILAKYIKENIEDSFIIASFAMNPDGLTAAGNVGRNLLEEANDAIDIVGFNCICGPHHMHNHIKELTFYKKPLSVMPNASYPTVIGHRVRYDGNVHYFAKQMMDIIEDGAKVIGGCCGTTPEFIQALSMEIQHQKNTTNNKQPKIRKLESKQVLKSDFYEKLKQGNLPIAVELDPPVNTDVRDFMIGAEKLKNVGVDLITIADCPVARARMDSCLLACKIKRELDIPVMPHMTCRDRNINASKALLMGVNMEQVTDVLLVTGDPLPSEQRNLIKSVYEFNSRRFLNYIRGLNETLFESPFYLYGALNINAVNFEMQLRLAKEKIENGAIGLFTQPVLSKEALDNLKKAKEELKVPIVGGILPIVSYRNACFINNEIPGIQVCDEIVACYLDKDREECEKLAIKISIEIAKEMKPYIDGYYLITPFKRVNIITEIIQGIMDIK